MVQRRAITDGFDLYPSNVGQLGYGINSTWMASRIGATLVPGRFGGQALRYASGGFGEYTRTFEANASVVFGLAYMFGQENLTGSFVTLRSSNGNEQIALHKTDDGRLRLLVGATIIAQTALPLLMMNVWNYIEMAVYCHDTAGQVRVNLNGVPVPELTLNAVDTRSSGVDTDIGRISLNGPNNAIHYFDDLYVEIDGIELIGEGRMEVLPVINDVSNTGFVPSSGSYLYPTISNVPASTANYISALNPADVFRMGVKPLSTVPEEIYGLMLVSLSQKDEAGTRTVRNRLWSDDTAFTGETEALTLNSYTFKDDFLAVDPDTTLAWTAAGVNAVEVGVEVIS